MDIISNKCDRVIHTTFNHTLVKRTILFAKLPKTVRQPRLNSKDNCCLFVRLKKGSCISDSVAFPLLCVLRKTHMTMSLHVTKSHNSSTVERPLQLKINHDKLIFWLTFLLDPKISLSCMCTTILELPTLCFLQ